MTVHRKPVSIINLTVKYKLYGGYLMRIYKNRATSCPNVGYYGITNNDAFW